MPRKNITQVNEESPNASQKASLKKAPRPTDRELDPDQVTPVRHSTADPSNDPEEESQPVSSVRGAMRPYFKGFPILKAYHGRQLKYFVKMADGMTCFMFQPGGDEEAMFLHLISEPKVASMVPLSMGEKRGEAIQHVQLNGLRMNVLKGRIVHIPQTVAEVLANSQADTAAALSEVETVNPFSGEATNANLAYKDESELRALTR